MRLSRVSALLLFLVTAIASISTARADSANNAFRVGAGYLDADMSDDATAAYFVNYERRLIPWLGIDLEVAYAKPDIIGTPTGSEQTFTGNAGVNFHMLARSRVDLYLGAYGAYTDFDQTFDSATGYGALAGIDVGLTKSGLALTASVRYTKIEAEWTGVPGATSDYDPLLAQLGIGWRF